MNFGMDINSLRSLVTAFSFALFIAFWCGRTDPRAKPILMKQRNCPLQLIGSRSHE